MPPVNMSQSEAVDSLWLVREGLVDPFRIDQPAYQGLSSAAIDRLRGQQMLTRAHSRFDEFTLNAVVEELDNGRSAFAIACAARAARIAGVHDRLLCEPLKHAIVNIRDHDDYVDLGGEGESETTAFAELLATVRWLGPLATSIVPALKQLASSNDRPLDVEQLADVQATVDSIVASVSVQRDRGDECCGWPQSFRALRWCRESSPVEASTILFEDHQGTRLSWHDVFVGRPTFAVFFYTRCDNPERCSLSIAQLADVQRRLDPGLAEHVGLVAITYDPDYDIPPRLREYVTSRGLSLGPRALALRVVDGRQTLHRRFQLEVSYAASLVNRHRVEAHVLDANACTVAAFKRLRWDPREVVAILTQQVRQPSDLAPTSRVGTGSSGAVRHVSGPVLTVAMALFPKCPLCGATYLSVSGIAALPMLPTWTWLFPALLVAASINLAGVGLLALRRRQWGPFALALAGALLTCGGLAFEESFVTGTGVALSLAASFAAVMARPEPDPGQIRGAHAFRS